MKREILMLLCATLFFVACISKKSTTNQETANIEKIGEISRLSAELDEIIEVGTEVEVLGTGYDWSEGPLWVEEGRYLIFSDVPQNSIFKWKEGEGVSLYLKPSGYTGSTERGGETGSNGLLLDNAGNLVLCQHGDRRIAVMNASLDRPRADFSTLADQYKQQRFNSPNDAVFDSQGNLYFTDPPYGLENRMDDNNKEIAFQGVYRVDRSGEVTLLTDQLERPNGIALSKDEKKLYVANSFGDRPIVMEYDLDEVGSITEETIFFDGTELKNQGLRGLPDGLKIGKRGHFFITGPGGLLIFSPGGVHLGTISTGVSISNCALDTDEEYIYATSDMYLIRVALKH